MTPELTTDPERTTTGDALRLLAASRRRVILTHLLYERDDAANYDELVTRIQWAEDGGAHERILADLYHTHLPMLAGSDVVEHDPEGETLAYAGGEDFAALLEAVRGYGD